MAGVEAQAVEMAVGVAIVDKVVVVAVVLLGMVNLEGNLPLMASHSS